MKFVIRRFIFAIITLPVVLAGYGLIYFWFGLLSPDGYGASVVAFLENLPAIGFAYVLCFSFYSQIARFVERVVNE